MDWRYTLSVPTLDETDTAAVAECLASGWLSMGPRTQEFETRFAAMSGARHALAVTNGTAALHLAYLALGLDAFKGDEIIQPAINFVAAANMTKAIGLVPVFADIVSSTEPTIDPDDVARRITPRTRAVVAMHFGGYPARMKALLDICERHGIPLIEDACHAPLTRNHAAGGRSLGTLGAVGCFSFFSNKNMTTGEGGMVVTDDDGVAARLRNLRSHGMTTLSWDRHQGRPSTYDVVAHGMNYRMDDLRSALGITQLARLEDNNRARQHLALRYRDRIAARCGRRVRFVFAKSADLGAAHLAAIVVPEAVRDALRLALSERRIQTSLHYPPVHLFSAFAGEATEPLPISEAFARSMITLPMYASLTDAAVDEIVDEIAQAMEHLCDQGARVVA